LLGQKARAGDILCLDGDLGAGKTTLTQAIARGLRVPESVYVTSPSFTLLHEYPGRLPLYHMDLYRLSGPDEVEDLGFLDYIYGQGVCVIEWAGRALELFPREKVCLTLSVDEQLHRIADITFPGEVHHFSSIFDRFPL